MLVRADQLYTSTLTVGEVLAKPMRQQRLDLVDQYLAFFRRSSMNLLTFDLKAAEVYAKIVIRARRQGHPMAVEDAQIAAIAASRQFSVATRDEAPFQAAGVPVINPWTSTPEA